MDARHFGETGARAWIYDYDTMRWEAYPGECRVEAYVRHTMQSEIIVHRGGGGLFSVVHRGAVEPWPASQVYTVDRRDYEHADFA